MNAIKPFLKPQNTLNIKSICQKYIRKAKLKRTPRERDYVAMAFMEYMFKALREGTHTNRDFILMDEQYQRYIEYAGEHETHDFESFQLNLVAILIRGYHDHELETRLEELEKTHQVLGWGSVYHNAEMLINDEKRDPRVFTCYKYNEETNKYE